MPLPIVHSNGTSRESLLEERREAYSKLNEALEALVAMSPNGRDYYPKPGTFEAAKAQHQSRIDKVAGLRDEILAEYEALDV